MLLSFSWGLKQPQFHFRVLLIFKKAFKYTEMLAKHILLSPAATPCSFDRKMKRFVQRLCYEDKIFPLAQQFSTLSDSMTRKTAMSFPSTSTMCGRCS
jgi:hypothetical protein